MQDNPEKLATLYWLHLDTHTDVFTEGYVGVTTRLIDTRFKEHCSRFKNTFNMYNPLHLAFAKYGIDNIIKTRLCICSPEDVYELEKIFRPYENMGWNSAQGGKLSPVVLQMVNRRRNALLKR